MKNNNTLQFLLLIHLKVKINIFINNWLKLIWNGTLVDINVDNSTQYSKFFHRFKIFKFYTILATKICFEFFGKLNILKVKAGLELMT